MIRFPKSLVRKAFVVAAASAVLMSSIGDASACDGKRGGGYGYRPAYYRPAYPTQCQQPYAYRQPVIQQPVQQPLVQQQFAQQPQFAQQQMPPQVQSTVVAGQGAAASVQAGASASAIGALGGANVQSGVQAGVPAQQSQIQQGQAQQSQLIAQQGGSAPATGNVAAAPTNAPAAPSTAQATAPSAPAAPAAPAPTTNAERTALDSALEALMGDTPAAAASQPVSAAPQAALPTGEFSATVSNGTQVRLSLRADGSFVWLATKSGKSFQGNFSVNGGSLTLLRSDNQKLEASLTPTEAGFKLRFAGQNDDGLAFVRA